MQSYLLLILLNLYPLIQAQKHDVDSVREMNCSSILSRNKGIIRSDIFPWANPKIGDRDWMGITHYSSPIQKRRFKYPDLELWELFLKTCTNQPHAKYGEWNENGNTETHLNYLGSIQNSQGKKKVVTSTVFWGLSKRGTSRILLFGDGNEFLGDYSVNIPSELPDRVDEESIIWESYGNDCNPLVERRLSFRSGIPNNFFIECRDGTGEFFQFNEYEN